MVARDGAGDVDTTIDVMYGDCDGDGGLIRPYSHLFYVNGSLGYIL